MNERTAVVTGASRGAGRGIAVALGQAGYTVYVTGRTRGAGDSPHGGTITETAGAIDDIGGRGVPVVVDHADDSAVADLFSTVRREQGRLDILVNNAAAVEGVVGAGGFWTKPLQAADLITVGLRSHYVAAWHAAPLSIETGGGLIVATGHYGAVSYHQSPAYGAQKAGSDKMIADMAHELRPHGVAAVSVWMGPVDTERARAHIASLPPAQRPTTAREHAEFTGRVVAALHASDGLGALSGRALIGAEIGATLGVTNPDGTAPTSLRATLGGPPQLHPSLT